MVRAWHHGRPRATRVRAGAGAADRADADAAGRLRPAVQPGPGAGAVRHRAVAAAGRRAGAVPAAPQPGAARPRRRAAGRRAAAGGAPGAQPGGAGRAAGRGRDLARRGRPGGRAAGPGQGCPPPGGGDGRRPTAGDGAEIRDRRGGAGRRDRRRHGRRAAAPTWPMPPSPRCCRASWPISPSATAGCAGGAMAVLAMGKAGGREMLAGLRPRPDAAVRSRPGRRRAARAAGGRWRRPNTSSALAHAYGRAITAPGAEGRL